jgi:hypothetical protein
LLGGNVGASVGDVVEVGAAFAGNAGEALGVAVEFIEGVVDAPVVVDASVVVDAVDEDNASVVDGCVVLDAVDEENASVFAEVEVIGVGVVVVAIVVVGAGVGAAEGTAFGAVIGAAFGAAGSLTGGAGRCLNSGQLAGTIPTRAFAMSRMISWFTIHVAPRTV